MPDTSPRFVQSNYFPYLVSDPNRELKINIDLGYLYIPPVAESAQSAVVDKTINPFYPNPGGQQQESLMNQSTVNRYKSQTLSAVTNGVMPQHVDITGSAYCTFLDGTISNSPHIYYDLIKGPDNITISPNSAVFNTVQPVQQVYQNTITNSNIANSVQQINAVGSVYLPPTTQTNEAIKNLNLKASTTYNIWTIDNLPYNNGINSNFKFFDYLGWFPQSGTQIQNLQPYAQVWPLSDMSMIQVYSSNSQISLTRKFPLAQDIIFDKEIRYTVFNSGTQDPNNFQAYSLGFAASSVPVGFVLKFNAVVSNTIPVPSGISSSTLLTEPRMIISWGKLDFTKEDLENSVSNNTNQDIDNNRHSKIFLYTLEISPNRSPKLFINYTKSDIFTKNPDINTRVVELPNLKPLNSPNKNSGAKTDNDYNLFVFYSGQYMKIGNEPDPRTWSDIKNIVVGFGTFAPPISYDHYLDSNSQINITAQFMNFMFAFGQPLFSPYDPINTTFNNLYPEKATSNTLNQVTSNNIVYIGSNSNYKDINDFINQKTLSIKASISKHASNTYEAYSQGDLFGPPTCYFDARCGFTADSATFNNFLVDMEAVPFTDEPTPPDVTAYLVSTKMTLPRTLGGHVFNFHSDDNPGEPDITDSYVRYFDKLPEDIDLSGYSVPPTISQILTAACTDLKVERNYGSQSGNTVELTSAATFTLINLNRNAPGKALLNFIRNNVAVIRIKAGYGDNLYPYFEGVITKVTAEESLQTTKFAITCEDLMQHLFLQEKTSLVSRQRINFFGQKYYDIINYLCDKTELKNHFKYDLGPEFNPQNPSAPTLYGQLKYDGLDKGTVNFKKLFRLPSLGGNAQKLTLNRMSVGSYVSRDTGSGNDTTYFGVLRQIASFMISNVTDITSNSNLPVDSPIMYWYTGVGINSNNIDGIKFSSRNGLNPDGTEKDEDKVYIRKSSLIQDNTDEQYNVTKIDYLHGLIVNSDSVYTSESNTNNLISLGIYRGFDNGGNGFSVFHSVPDTMTPPEEVTINSYQYIGYNRILIFDDPKDKTSTSTTLPQSIMGDPVQAKLFIENVIKAFYLNVLETIAAKIYVTKPLNDWGHFKIYFEDEQQPIIEDKFFYTRVNYVFDINKNLIIADINGGKKPLYI